MVLLLCSHLHISAATLLMSDCLEETVDWNAVMASFPRDPHPSKTVRSSGQVRRLLAAHCGKTIAPAFANSPSDWVTNAQKASTGLTGSFATRLRRNIEEITKRTGGGSLEPREFVTKRPFDRSLQNLSLRKHQRWCAVSPRSADMPMAATFTENSLTSAMPSRGGSKRKGRGGGTKFDRRWRLPALAARLRRCTR